MEFRMWDQIFKRWVDLFFWWLPRDEKGEEGARGATQERAAPAPEQAAGPEPKAAQEARPDDLTVIKGIGPAVQERLRLVGITTFRDLAAANPDSLVDQLKASVPVSKARVHAWTEAARERTEARGRST